MDDYYEMVLEAAGRTGRNPHSLPPFKRCKGSYADDDRADAGGKLSASQVPSKKKLDPIERGNMAELDEMLLEAANRTVRNQHFQSPSGSDSKDWTSDSDESDHYEGEEDRKRLAKMSEIKREMILAEHANRRNGKDFKNSIKKQKETLNQSRKDNPPPHSVNCSVRSSADRATAKDDALRVKKMLR